MSAAAPGRRLAVLKFGSSVLSGPAGFRAAAEHLERVAAGGCAVVAVVSAPPGNTDRLLRWSSELAESPAAGLLTRLLATGEASSAALLGLALDGLGVCARVLEWSELGLRTRGQLLDADPEELDDAHLARLLEAFTVLVTPGFVGVDRSGAAATLGRGGSDLTALFLATALGASECCLVKDVAGLHPTDPAGVGPRSRPLGRASYAELSSPW